MNKNIFYIFFIFFCSKLAANEQFSLGDGESIINYYFEKPKSKTFSIAIIFQGSDCASGYKLFKKLKDRLLKQNHAVLVIEKTGVTSTSIDKQKYLKQNSMLQRIDDAKTVLQNLKNNSDFTGQLLIIGGSEGSTIAIHLASILKEQVCGVILLATSSLTNPFENQLADDITQDLTSKYWFLPYSITLWCLRKYCNNKFKAINQNPNSTTDTAFGFYSYNWWTIALKLTNEVASLIKNANFPIVVAYGEYDDPTNSNKKFEEELNKLGKTNVFIKSYPGLNHTFCDLHGQSFVDQVFDNSIDCLKSMA